MGVGTKKEGKKHKVKTKQKGVNNQREFLKTRGGERRKNRR
jgi:hypothetical protein